MHSCIYWATGYQLLEKLASEFWCSENDGLPTDILLPDMSDAEEPVTIKALRRTLPCMGRRESLKMLRNVVSSSFDSWKQKGRNQQLPLPFSVPFVCGGPGTGKTHFCSVGLCKMINNVELSEDDPFTRACIISAQNRLNIGFSFYYGLANGEAAYPEISLALRIIYELFKGRSSFRRHYPTSFEFLSVFMPIARSSLTTISLSDIGRFLTKKLSLRDDHSAILFVHLDDVDQILQGPDSNYFKDIINAFEGFNAQQNDIFFSVLLSGTDSTAILKAIDARGGGAIIIDLDLVTSEEYCKGLSQFLSMQIGNGPVPPPFKTTDISKGIRRILMDIEGVPKLFVALLHVLSRPEQAGKSEGLPFGNWSIDRQRIREIVGDSTFQQAPSLVPFMLVSEAFLRIGLLHI
ncbi:hypothetical protein EDD85DRAFT_783165 [Armillaria nabsnona]|nr:hypothetical protein EDD85DRAFT_783165 [Armillaria nabsnona]